MKKINYIKGFVALFLSLVIMSCNNTPQNSKDSIHEEEEEAIVSLSKEQVKAISLKIGELKKMNLNSFVSTNGLIDVPPHERVDLSAIIGANIKSIKVLEGQFVKKGEVLATLEHPNLIDIQVQYKKAYSQLKYLNKEHERLKTLVSKQIASGKEFQRIDAEYNTAKAEYSGLKAKLEMIGVNSKRLKTNDAQSFVAIKAPISGVVSKINVNRGKYVEPQTEMFEIINTKHLHADLQVYEKDLTKVRKGQEVILTINENAGKEYNGKLISIGKSFDETTRAITVQVEISPVPEELVPGLFIKGRIITGEQDLTAVPLEAIVTEGDKSYIFIVENKEHDKIDHHGEERKESEHEKDEHEHKTDVAVSLKMIEVFKGISDRGYIEIKPLIKLEKDTHIALNGAYYLLAEMKKSEAEHSH